MVGERGRNNNLMAGKIGRNNILRLDPRCKLFMLLVGNLLLFFHVNLVTEVVLMLCFLVPFMLSAKWKTAVRFAATYLVLLAADIWLVPAAEGVVLSFVSLLAVGIRMMFPCIVTGAYAFSTTSVSEFVCALRKMKVPEAVVIPCMVVIRFFPTVREDYRQIKNSMALRGLGGTALDVVCHPMRRLEYVVIPLLMNSNNVAQDLSVAALTKGLGMEGEHTSMTQIRMRAVDYIYMAVCAAPLCAYIAM